jgi:DnaK suppressor protein
VAQEHIHRSQPAITGSAHLERLLAEKVSLESELGRRPDVLHPAGIAVEDQPWIMHDQFISLHRNKLAYTKLKEVEGAMDRVRSGDYGTCEGCETPISERRLNAVPWARYCLTCQENVSAGRDQQNSDQQNSDVRLVA